jgi:putative ABC transport system permease protein
MNKLILLPRLSVMGLRKNGSTYVPYLLASIFSVFVFFVFSSILHNDIMKTLPHSGYIWALMQIGQLLLAFILLPFLMYANSFLIKRRKKELGLYSVLGLEKKHIAIMMICETLIMFGIVIIGGILFGLVFSKLLFLVLLNICRLPVDTAFSFSFNAVSQTFICFLVVYGLNLIMNLIQVFKSNPNDLIKGSKKGDMEPKRLWITALLGLIFLAAGYIIAIPAKIDSGIFQDFLLAVAFVVFGTHQFFKAGLIALLKILKRNTGFYYRESNYVTISGMLHRMKKSASSLANICVFGTMTIITLLCTFSLWFGTDSIMHHHFPYDVILNFNSDKFQDYDALGSKLQELSKTEQVEVTDMIEFKYVTLHVGKSKDTFKMQNSTYDFKDRYAIKLISLEDYNRIEQKQETLSDNEVMIFAAGSDFGYSQVILGITEYKVKKELDKIVFESKAVNDDFGQDYYIIMKDAAIIDKLGKDFKSTSEKDRFLTIRFQLTGAENSREEFTSRIIDWSSKQTGYNSVVKGIWGRQEATSMNGGLLFLGIFFSLIFSMCLILIMYYKQITEGYDDRESFDIMQKVGMSDEEVRSTIKKQILMVFFLPMFMAVLHTMAGFMMITRLFGAMYLFDVGLIAMCGIGVVTLFTLLYGLSYAITSRTYYRIVKQMNY